MNRQDVINAVHRELQKSGVTKKVVTDIVTSAFAQISGALQDGDNVAIHDFGVFRVSERQARKTLNPQTKEPIQTPAHKRATFRPCPSLKRL